jgi:hypothetical protein
MHVDKKAKDNTDKMRRDLFGKVGRSKNTVIRAAGHTYIRGKAAAL